MAVLSWGKPKIEIRKFQGYDSEGKLIGGEWTEIDTPVTETTQLETTAGDKVEAKEEGGGMVDSYQQKSSYILTFELFIKKLASGGIKPKPIADNDGIIDETYSLRLTPSDANAAGFQFDKCSVGVSETFNSTDGGRWVYTFTALVPDNNSAILKRCVNGEVVED